MFRQLAVAALLSISAVMAGALPSMARPATISIEANLRSGASLQAPIRDGLPVGTPVEVLNIAWESQRGDYWYYLRSSGTLRTEGWVRSNLVQFHSTSQIYGTLRGTRDDRINIRSAPSTQSAVQHHGLSGDLVEVGGPTLGRDGYNWYRVTFPNRATGWVRGDLISIWPKGCIITCANTW